MMSRFQGALKQQKVVTNLRFICVWTVQSQAREHKKVRNNNIILNLNILIQDIWGKKNSISKGLKINV